MFQKARLREPTFKYLRFNGFEPMEFVNAFKNAKLGSYEFNIKMGQSSSTIDIIHRDGIRDTVSVSNGDVVVVNEDETWFVMDEKLFRQTYERIEEKDDFRG